MIDITITEREAAEYFARTWNRLDAEPIELFLNDETVYESQMVLTPLVGKKAILEYLEGKFITIKQRRGSMPYFELGLLYGHQPCVIMYQGSKRNPVGLALFKVEGPWIKRIDLCIVPSYTEAVPTGQFPS